MPCDLDNRAPGCSVQFTVEPQTHTSSSNPRYGPDGFGLYMTQNYLYIDVWNADTFMHMGSACVNLKYGLRQGHSGVYFEDDVDIVWNEVKQAHSNVFFECLNVIV